MRLLAVTAASTLALAATPAFGQSAPELVRVELARPGTVLEATEAWSNWHTYWTNRSVVCIGPCVAQVPSAMMYRISGPDMPPSSHFSLPARERVRLDVSPGNSFEHAVGAVLTLAGGLSAAGGLITLLAGNGSKPEVVGGVAFLGAGAVVLGVGIPLLLASMTTVHFE
jgi:hypothetical protein